MPKREKARILAAMQQSSSSRSHERAVTAELEDEGRLMTTVIRAHIETCDFTQEKIRPVLQQARENPNFCSPSSLVSCAYFCISTCLSAPKAPAALIDMRALLNFSDFICVPRDRRKQR